MSSPTGDGNRLERDKPVTIACMDSLLGKDREDGNALPLREQLRFDAGSVALNLLATRGWRRTERPIERIDSPQRLADWLAGNGLPAVPVGEADLLAAHQLREAAYGVLAAALAGVRPSAADLRCLNDWAARPLPGPTLRWQAGQPAWRPTPVSVQVVLIGLARDLAVLAVEGAADLRACDGPACGMLYLDRSRGRRRRWCSMERCGNAAKAAQHRARAQAHR